MRVLEKRNRGAAVDPSVVPLGDGRLRMYFFGSEATRGDPAAVPGDHAIYSAISEDGLMFTEEPRLRLTLGGVPGAVELSDGRVRIFASGRGEILSAVVRADLSEPPQIEPGARC